jgi:hypothetical protein
VSCAGELDPEWDLYAVSACTHSSFPSEFGVRGIHFSLNSSAPGFGTERIVNGFTHTLEALVRLQQKTAKH